MYVDAFYLQSIKDEYNNWLFYGRLPHITFYPLHTYSLGGCCTVDHDSYGNALYYVGVTDYYDLNDTQVRQILLHELIHVYLYTMYGTDGLRHGKLFKQEMARLSQLTGLSVTIRADVNAPKRHNFLKAWLKTGREESIGLNEQEAFRDRPPLMSKGSGTWYN